MNQTKMGRVYISYINDAGTETYTYPIFADEFLAIQARHGPNVSKETLDKLGYFGYNNFPHDKW